VYELDADSGRFKRSNTNDYLKDASGGTDATLAKLSESKGKIDDNISLVRKRVTGSGESIFTFQGRE
jgi:hypothetical protein